MHLVYTEVLVQKWFMMSFWPLLSTLLLSQFNLRHLQFWKALLSQNPHIFYIFLSVIMFKTLKFSVLLKSSHQFICPCKLLFFSSILHFYCVCHFFWKSLFKASFHEIEGLFTWVCACVLLWMYQKIISPWCYMNKRHN